MKDKLEIFTSPHCVGCKMAKKFFADKNVNYIEKDITKDELARKELEMLGISSVPVIRFNGKMIIGFQKAQMEDLVEDLVDNINKER